MSNAIDQDKQLQNIYWFDAFSSMSWQMCLTSPLVLFMRALGAPALALGLLAGLNPLMSVLQLPMSRHVTRIGHRRLMQFGWTARTIVITPLIVLPLAADTLGRPLTIALVLSMIAVFTILRSVAVVAWLPWMASLVPAESRGAFLSRGRFFMNVTSLAGLGLSAILLAQSNLHDYSEVFLIGVLAAYISIFFLTRIPSTRQAQPAPASPAPETANSVAAYPPAPASLREVLRIQPFRRLILFSALAQIVNLGAGAFVTVFARTRVGLSDSNLLWLSAGASLLVMIGMTLVRSRLDRLGSKPFLWITLGWWTTALLTWLTIAATGTTLAPLIAPVLLIVTESFAWMFELFNMRLAMNTLASPDNSATGFAVYSVVVNVAAGIAPITFGALLDTLRFVTVQAGSLLFDNYTALFAIELGIVALAALALRRVRNA
jgi:Major Facilitator Superfamily